MATSTMDSPFNFQLDEAVFLFLTRVGVLPCSSSSPDALLTRSQINKDNHSRLEWVSLIPTHDAVTLLAAVPAQLLPPDFPLPASTSAATLTPSRQQLLDTLARLALEPALTLEIMRRFRPLTVHFWGRWLEMLGWTQDGHWASDSDEDGLVMASQEEKDAVFKVYRAMVSVLSVWENIFPFLATLLRHPLLSSPPIPAPSSSASELAVPLLTLHSLLTSLPHLPSSTHTATHSHLPWTFPSPVELILKTHPHRGTRLLAWRILRKWYGLYANSGEDLREKWVWKGQGNEEDDAAPLPSYVEMYQREYEQIFGVFEGEHEQADLVQEWGVECMPEARFVEGGIQLKVRVQSVDVWVLPALEDLRTKEERENLWASNVVPPEWLGESATCAFEASLRRFGCLAVGELSLTVVSVEGQLLFREGFLPDSTFSILSPASGRSPATVPTAGTSLPTTVEPFVLTPSTSTLLRTLALHLQRRLPVLITSPPSSGKSSTITHLWSLLHSAPSSPSTPTPHARKRGLVFINLADRSLDSKSLLGSLSSAPATDSTEAGTFTFVEGPLTRAVRQGRWIVLTSIDQASVEVLSVIKVLVERMRRASEGVIGGSWGGGAREEEGGVGVRVGGGQGRWVRAGRGFMLFATRSVDGAQSEATFFASHFFSELFLKRPGKEEVELIVEGRYERLGRAGLAKTLIEVWESARDVGARESGGGTIRNIGVRDLMRWCRRVEGLLPNGVHITSIESNPVLQEEVFTEARDVFLGSLPAPPPITLSDSRDRYTVVAKILADGLGLSAERADWVLRRRVPELVVPKTDEDDGLPSRAERVLKIGRVALPYRTSGRISHSRPYALTKPSLVVLEKLAVSLRLSEPVLMVGETGTGKTAAVGHLAELLGKNLTALNLSNQTEAGDLVGGFRPIDEAEEARRVASQLVNRFVELFAKTFSLTRNAEYVSHVRKAFDKKRWQRLVSLWREAFRMATERLAIPSDEPLTSLPDAPRKRRKFEPSEEDLPSAWRSFVGDVGDFDSHHVQKAAKAKFIFSFVEGPLAKAIRNGDWVLLDEVNLASPETLESLSTLLQTPDSSLVLTEQGDLEPIPRHPDFRLFACMNPATDVGKRDLPLALRSKFTEMWVPPPDEDREALITIVHGYIGRAAVKDRAVILDVAELYSAVKSLQSSSQLADGSNQPPHFSMRTLARALSFGAEFAPMFELRRALYEGFLMAFTMLLDVKSTALVRALLDQHIVSKAKNRGSLFAQIPAKPVAVDSTRFGPYWLETGNDEVQEPQDYILTPSVQAKVLDLARAILTRKVPVLIQGPTSAGKTSVVEYLAKRTGHRFVRINNHEHTDIQEYIGTYVSDPISGKLVFQEGVLVRALRRGDWIVLDELNLAPTDVLEALNRLLDDNRELVIPETGEVVRPHPHFMLFATQNPPGLYGGRKVLSRAFRNRFLEMHFGDVPQNELETILCQRCQIAPSYAKKTVAVFVELQRRRQAGRVFEQKQAFATLRDLFRWGGRGSVGYQQLAEDGYMLLAERARRLDDKRVVKEVIEHEMKVTIEEATLYDFRRLSTAGLPEPPIDAQLVWTNAMRRLYFLIAAALLRNEPVLLVGETGSGKTSVCQAIAAVLEHQLHVVGCHQNTETADLLGGQRPLRSRSAVQAALIEEARSLIPAFSPSIAFEDSVIVVESYLATSAEDKRPSLGSVVDRMRAATALFEWHDGPLVQAMQAGDHILLDEISLADDSVLERLNSVLEPSRTLVLAEKGGRDLEDIQIVAKETFQILATMNPGGDFGKKELSPALRNRFTEIWVPHVDDREDLLLIIAGRWRDPSLKVFGPKILDFGHWFGDAVGILSGPGVGLRDILAWVDFINAATLPPPSPSCPSVSPSEAFCHGAMMTIVDGLGAFPATSGLTKEGLAKLRHDCFRQLEVLLPTSSLLGSSQLDVAEISGRFYVGQFGIPRGDLDIISANDYALQAPTTRLNAMRLVRALQLSKPVLLEGSPGVGKTSLVTALAAATGHHLVRINLSDQTDLMDLLGSDLPVEGGRSGEFAWKDAPFLAAMQQGSWVLLDEMNLASQAVLEGLNSSLDHRGTVYIPELDRTFARHPNFRIFAAQNPLGQGGGRKGLPRSFLDRFSIVHMEELDSIDLIAIAQTLYPHIDTSILERMIAFNTTVHRETMESRTFGTDGSPWEFNLRDVLRWLSLVKSSTGLDTHPGAAAEYVGLLYLQRFRNLSDRTHVARLFSREFNEDFEAATRPWPSITPRFIQLGHSLVQRSDKNLLSTMDPSSPLLQSSLPPLEALAKCVEMGWLGILTGPRGSGKSTMVRQLASAGGNVLHEFSMNAEVDTLELLGTFEQAERYRELGRIADDTATLLRHQLLDKLSSPEGNALHHSLSELASLQATFNAATTELDVTGAATIISRALDLVAIARASELRDRLLIGSTEQTSSARFEWIDGPLVRAMKNGDWLLIEDANLCSPSVLDRLNSLFEPGGRLQLAERGPVHGEIQVIVPHPRFRLIMTLDPRNGELSRAMRNRGIEIALLHPSSSMTAEDDRRVQHFRRSPTSTSSPFSRSTRTLLSSSFALTSALQTSPVPLDTDHFAGNSFEDAGLCRVGTLVKLALTSHSRSPGSSTHLLASASSPVQHGTVLRLARALLALDVGTVDFTLRYLRVHPLSASIKQSTLQIASSRSIPPALLVHQPMDLAITPNSAFSLTESIAASFPVLASVFVDSPRRPEIVSVAAATPARSLSVWDKSLLSAAGRLLLEDADPAIHAIAPLVLALGTLVEKLLADLSMIDSDSTIISSAASLRSLMFELRHVSDASIFDASSTQHVASWIAIALKELPSSVTDAAVDAHHQLHPLVTSLVLHSGKAMSQIWEAFLPYRPSNPRVNDFYQRLLALGRIEGVVNGWDAALVTLYLDVTTSLGVPLLSDHDSNVLDNMDAVEKLMLKLPSAVSVTVEAVTRDSNAASLIAVELSAVASVFSNRTTTTAPEVEILAKAIHSSGNILPLSSVVVLRQMQAFSSLADHSQPSSTPLAVISGWVERLGLGLQFSPTEGARVSQDLVRPALLNAVVQLRAIDSSTLGNLSTLSEALTRAATLQTLAAAEPISRLDSLRTVLNKAILLIAGQPSTPATFLLSTLLSSQRLLDPAISEAVDSRLAHILPGLDSKDCTLQTLGEGYVAFARFLWLLYVPNRPLDPAVGHRAQACYVERQIASLGHLLSAFEGEDKVASGNGRNARISAIRRDLDSLQHQSSTGGTILVNRVGNSPLLSSLFLELQSFRQQIASDSQLDDLLSAIRAGWTIDASSRESNLQQSVATLLRRLELAYADFADILAPIRVALCCLMVGFTFLAQAGQTSLVDPDLAPYTQLLTRLVSFPSVASHHAIFTSDLPLSIKAGDSTLPPSQATLLQIAALVASKRGEDGDGAELRRVTKLYDRMYYLWTSDRRRAEEEALEAESLYRSKADVQQIASDEEQEAAEFAQLFPTYDIDANLDGPQDSKDDSHDPTSKSSVRLVLPSDLVTLARLHDARFAQSRHAPSTEPFNSLRHAGVIKLFAKLFDRLDVELDLKSAPWRVASLVDFSQSFEPNVCGAEERDFYVEPDVRETAKAVPILEALYSRLGDLIDQWPDQIVLQNLRDRCLKILALSSKSPIAQVLTAIEQLLTHTEDWESYASREHSLALNRSAITNLIVEWRRLELTCWSRLLSTVQNRFGDPVAEWWFRFYEVAIRGAPGMDSDGVENDQMADEGYFKDLVSLLDGFLSSSSAGQFATRLRLVFSFGKYAAELGHILDQDERGEESLRRVSRILFNIHNFYDQFTLRVNTHLKTERARIEKDVQNLIKLASWKDVNVFALRQSAIRSHHQLYKSVRKLRTVLQKPASDFFVLADISAPVAVTSLAFTSPSVPDHLPSLPAELTVPPIGAHLLRLDQTVRRLATLVSSTAEKVLGVDHGSPLDDFAMQVITTAKSLREEQLGPKEGREQRVKSLATRKRRAWIELLRELKRIGLSPTPSPAIVARLSNAGAVYSLANSQSLLATSDARVDPSQREQVLRTDAYHFRLLSQLPSLHGTPSSHHDDISTREVQRAVGSIESLMSIGFDNREKLLSGISTHADLAFVILRLEVTMSTDVIQPPAPSRALCLELHRLVAQAVAGVAEADVVISKHEQASGQNEESTSFRSALREAVTVLLGDERELGFVLDETASLEPLLTTPSEYQTFQSAEAHLTSTVQTIAAFTPSLALRYIHQPLSEWLSSFVIPTVHPLQTLAPTLDQHTKLNALHQGLINSILIVVQDLSKISHSKGDDLEGELSDLAIKSANQSFGDASIALRLSEIFEQTIDFVRSVHEASTVQPASPTVHSLVLRVIPFLRQYSAIVHHHLVTFLRWHNASLKLAHVLTAVVKELATAGFCKPSEDDGSGKDDGENGQTSEGTGMADGKGAKNVSDQIEDESQVEGMQGDVEQEKGEKEDEKEGEDDAVEMSMDFDGEMEDRGDGEKEEKQDGEESDDDDESQPDPEEQVADVDPLDPSSVDEKFWGEESSNDTSKEEVNQETSQSAGEAEMTAKDEDVAPPPSKSDAAEPSAKEVKDDAQPPPDSGDTTDDTQGKEDDGEGQDDEEEGDAGPQADNGESLDQKMPEADNLDLPDDLQLDGEEKKEAELDLGSESGDLDDLDNDKDHEAQEENTKEDSPDSAKDKEPTDEDAPMLPPEDGEPEASHEVEQNPSLEPSIGGVDKGDGTGGDQNQGLGKDESSHNTAREEPSSAASPPPTDSEAIAELQQERPDDSGAGDMGDESATAPSNAVNGRSQQRSSASDPKADPSSQSQQPAPQAQDRSLGDALKSWRRRLEAINDLKDSESTVEVGGDGMEEEVEYVAEGQEHESDGQALGPARDDQVQRLEHLQLEDEEEPQSAFEPDSMDVDNTETAPPAPSSSTLQIGGSTLQESDAKAIPAQDLQPAQNLQEARGRTADEPQIEDLEKPEPSSLEAPLPIAEDASVELSMLEWRTSTASSLTASDVWRLYTSLTLSLSHSLTEQLRLILEPTLATRLKGDYRSGKRLNMKKIIPYIASEFTKDKIWLRRTRPSAREYQILIAIDDSKSMADSHSVHLAYQSLALISGALTRLEVGGISICRFGDTMDVLHEFEQGAVSDEAGATLLGKFTFNQKTTDVRLLVEKSLQHLERAKEKASVSAGELWQLQIIISDGVCQDHEKLRALLRRAAEQKVLFVFVVIDSLHRRTTDLAGPSSASTTPANGDTNQNSILAMKSVSYSKAANGQLELTMERYLDTFPFEYFVVLRDAEALPEVLSATLRQFFERVSSDR